MGKLEPKPELQSLQEDMEYDDEIEILEVVGLDESGVPLEAEEPAADEVEELEEVSDEADIVLDFDEAGDATAVVEMPPPGEAPATADERRSGAPREGDGVTDDVARDDRDRLVRLHADFENYKKRIEREQGEFRRHAAGNLIRRLLPVLDNFERAVAAAAEEGDEGTMRDGVILIFKGMLEELRTEGLVAVDTVGQPFDPNVHEAVATDADPELPSNTVVEELQRGYLMHNRLLRPALVKVNLPDGMAGPESDPEDGGDF